MRTGKGPEGGIGFVSGNMREEHTSISDLVAKSSN